MTWIAPKTTWSSADGVANTDLNRIEEDIRILSQQGGALGTTTNSGNAYSVAASPPLTTLSNGSLIVIVANASSTGAPTLNPNGLGAKAILKANGNAAALLINAVYTLRYSAAAAAGAGAFILQGEGGGGSAVASDILSGKTATVDSGDVTGTIPDMGATSFSPSTASQPIALGKYNGSGVVNPVTGTAGVSDVKSGKTFASANGIGLTGTLADTPWMGDLAAHTSHYAFNVQSASIGAGAWATALSVSGAGWLCFFQVEGNGSGYTLYPDIRVTINGGTPVIFTGLNSGGLFSPTQVTFPLSYNTSLLIEVRNGGAGADTVEWDYAYLAKTGTPNPATQTIMSSSSRKVASASTTSASADVCNITGAGWLMGMKFALSGTVSNTGKVTLIIDGVTQFSLRPVAYQGNSNYKHLVFYGPVRFSSSLRVQIVTDNASLTIYGDVFYTLD